MARFEWHALARRRRVELRFRRPGGVSFLFITIAPAASLKSGDNSRESKYWPGLVGTGS